MTHLASRDLFVGFIKHDRSYNVAMPARPTAPPTQPVDPAALRWLGGLPDSAGLDGLEQPWWRLLIPALATLFATWRQRSRRRRQLAQIDARSLREAGIDPGAASFEARQPFWIPEIQLREGAGER